MKRWCLAASVLMGACSDGDGAPATAMGDSGSAVSDSASGADAVSVPPDTATPEVAASACGPGQLDECLYRPTFTYDYTTRTVEKKIVYKDLTGADRVVNIALYMPTGAPTPAPVVLLSHGGNDGKTDPMNSMEHWAPVFAKAGYFTVAIAHAGRDDASYAAACLALEVQPDIPCAIKIHWDRPHDVAKVLDFLEERVKEPELAGKVDLERIAHVGHSAGAGAVLMSLGATRNFKCAQPVDKTSPNQKCLAADLVSLVEPRIDVAVALSPQGPDNEGFMAESFAAVEKPVLMATGLVDGDGVEPANRLTLWPALPAPDKYKLYLDSSGAKHTLFEGSTDACVKALPLAECEELRGWIFAAGLAFVDAHLLGDARAAAWLASEDLVTAGHGVATFERK